MQKPNQLANTAKRWLARAATFLVLIVPVLLISSTAYAIGWEDMKNLAANTIGGGAGVKTALLSMQFVIGGLLTAIYSLAQSMAEHLINSGNILLEGEAIHSAWKIMLAATNSLLALALAIMAVLIMTGAQNYNIKKALTALIGAVVVANLSYSIVLALVAIGDALKDVIVTAFTNSEAAVTPGKEWLDTMGSFFAAPGEGFWEGLKNFLFEDVSSVALRTIVSIVTLGVGAYVMLKVCLVLIERAVRLSLAIVIAPLVFVVQLFPGMGLDSMSKNWWNDVIKWVLVYPGVYLLLSLAALISRDKGINISESLVLGFVEAKPDVWAEIMRSIASIAITLGVGNVPGLLGIKGGFAENFFNKKALPLAQNTATLGAQAIALKNPKGMVGQFLDFKDRFLKSQPERIKANREALTDLKDKTKFSRAITDSKPLFDAKQKAREQYFNQHAPTRFPQLDAAGNPVLDARGKPVPDPTRNSTNLTPSEQDQLENEETYQNLPAVKAYEANKKIIKERSGKLREKVADRNLDAEEAGAELAKKFQLRDKLAARKADTSEVDADILGLAMHMQSMAARGGTASVPWKDKANEAFFGPNATSLMKAGFQAPKSRYTYTPKQKRDYESTLGPRGTDLVRFEKLNSDFEAAQTEATAAKKEVDATADEIKKHEKDAAAEIASINARGETELADALTELQHNKQLENMVTSSTLQAAIGEIQDTTMQALERLDQATYKDLMGIASDTSLSDTTKTNRIRALLDKDSEAKTLGNDQLDRLTTAIGQSNGSFLQRGHEARAIISKGIKNPTVAPTIQTALNAPANIRTANTKNTAAQTRLAKAQSTTAVASSGINDIETKVGEHPGYVELARTRLNPTQQKAARDYAATSITQSTTIGIDATTGNPTPKDRLTLRELLASGDLKQTDIDKERKLVRDWMALSTGAVRGREDIDVSNDALWLNLTNAQRRDIMTKIWASNRSLLEGRHGQPPPSTGTGRTRP